MTAPAQARIGVLALAVGALLSACGGGDSVPRNIVTVGRVGGSDAFVAVAKYGSSVDAYVCDGRKVAETFEGHAPGSRIDIRSADGARLQATVTGSRISGRFTPIGAAPLPFTARAATKAAGLYRAKAQAGGQTFTAGWVLLPDGEQRGVVRNGSTLMPAPMLDGVTNRVTIAGMTVTAMLIDEHNH